MDFLVCLCVLAVVWGFVKTEDQPKEFVLGGTLTLKPEDWSTPITSITWKHQGNLLVDQSGTSEPDYYGQFRGRASLDFKTGELKISKLTKEDAGNYTVEINNKMLPVGYQVNIITAVPVPSVVVKPLKCSKNSEDCSLHCEGNVDNAGTVQYFWKEDKDWKKSTMKMEIKNDENTRKIKEFMCKVKNSVGEEESAAFPNPFYKEVSSSVGKAVPFFEVTGSSVGNVVMRSEEESAAFPNPFYEETRSSVGKAVPFYEVTSSSVGNVVMRSEKESAAFPNPFYEETRSSVGKVVLIIRGVIFILAIIAGTGEIIHLYKNNMLCW